LHGALKFFGALNARRPWGAQAPQGRAREDVMASYGTGLADFVRAPE
jgi:hypothetical protein